MHMRFRQEVQKLLHAKASLKLALKFYLTINQEDMLLGLIHSVFVNRPIGGEEMNIAVIAIRERTSLDFDCYARVRKQVDKMQPKALL